MSDKIKRAVAIFLSLAFTCSALLTSLNLAFDPGNENLKAGMPGPDPTHFSDPKGGYGLAVPESFSPDIDGVKNPGEWDGAKYDEVVDGSGTLVMNVSAKINANFLYVLVEVHFDDFGDNIDYCEIAFDSDHDGAQLEPGDRKFKLFNNDNVESFEGDGAGSWIPTGVVWIGNASDNPVLYEFRIDIADVWSGFVDDGSISGFMVHVYSNDKGSGDEAYGYWPDRYGVADGQAPPANPIDDPMNWGDLFYKRPRLVINEVAPFGADNEEWIELYNGGTSIDMNGINITDQNGNEYEFGSLIPIVMPPNSYLVLRSGIGVDDPDLTDGVGILHIGGSPTWDFDSLNDNDDVLLRYGGNDCGIDFMNYTNYYGSPDGNPRDTKSENTWSLAKGGWLFSPQTVGVSLARMPNGIDTNDSYDWVITSFTTEAGRNTLGTSSPGYGLVAQNSSKAPTIDGRVSAVEWGDSKFDVMNNGSVEYFTVYSRISGSYLYISVVLDQGFDIAMSSGDLCALVFDRRHDHGSAPRDDDWYMSVTFTGMTSYWEAKQGTGTAWGPPVWPAGWEAIMDDDGGTELACEFRLDASVIFNQSEGELIGFGVYVYNALAGDRVYWPDIKNPSSSPEDIPVKWGHLIYERPMFLINRLSPAGSGLDEIIELYNNQSNDLVIHNITIGDLDGNEIMLPTATIPPYNYLAVRGGIKAHDFDFTDGRGMFYTGEADVWDDGGDDVIIMYRGNNCTLDYMRYGTGSNVTDHPSDTTSNSNWTQNTAIIQAPSRRQILYREPNGMDTNMSSDWQRSEYEASKTFYLHDDGEYAMEDNHDIANTTRPMNPADTDYDNSGNEGVVISWWSDPPNDQSYQKWNITPAFAEEFEVFHELKVVVWIIAMNDPGQPLNLTASLYDSLNNPIGYDIYSPNTWPTSWTEVTFHIGVLDHKVPQGEYIYLKVNRTDATAEDIYLMFDTDWAPSHIGAKTPTFVHVDDSKYYDVFTDALRNPAEYFLGEDVRIRANVSDPIGSYDIRHPGEDWETSGANISIWAPSDPVNPMLALDRVPMTLEDADPSPLLPAWKRFKFTIPSAMITEIGTYAAMVTGWESNGIGDNRTTTFEVFAQSPIDNIELIPPKTPPIIAKAGGTISGYKVIGWNDPAKSEKNITWEPVPGTTDSLGNPAGTGGDWFNGYTFDYQAFLSPGFDNITIKDATSIGVESQSPIEIRGNALDHISLTPLKVFPATRPINASGTLTDYIAIGWNDALESEQNQTWTPNWGTTDSLGTPIDTGGDWLNGYTADYQAGLNPGFDNITVTDSAGSGITSQSAIEIWGNSLHHIELTPMHVYPGANVTYAGTTLTGFKAIGWNDAGETEKNTTWLPFWDTTDGRGTAVATGGDWDSGFTADYQAGLAPGFDNITVSDLGAFCVMSQSSIEIRGNQLDHLTLDPMYVLPSAKKVKAGGKITGYYAVGWNDPGETEKNRTWTPTWATSNGLGTPIPTGGNWDEGYTANYQAGFAPGIDNITVHDSVFGDISRRSAIEVIANELHHIELTPMYIFPGANAVQAGATLTGYHAVGWNDPGENEKNRTWEPVWGETDGFGTATSTGGNWAEGYTADYTAGTVLAFDNITIRDKTFAGAGTNISCIQIVAGPPHDIVFVSGNDQNGTAGTSLQKPFVVEIRDQYGNPVSPGWPVWFNITTSGLNGDGYLNTTNPVTTDASGRASTILTLDTIAGTNTVTAEISGLGDTQIVFQASGNLPLISTNLAANVTKVLRGNEFHYIINLDNKGTEAAANVFVNITISNPLSYVSDTSGTTRMVTGNKYTWIFPTLPEGPFSFILTLKVDAGTQGGTQILKDFTVDYSDQAGNPQPRVKSNTVTITILSEPIINKPPTIDGVPDLYVHYEFDYSIDLSPYINDIDNNKSDLFLILSDTLNVRVDPANNLGIILNYSINYNGTTQVLNITVSDGLGSDWDIINVNVTDEFPPELKELLPNVFLDEDTVAFPFNVTEYFDDRGGIVAYSTVGNMNVNITFLTNGTVYIVPDPNWFGLEKVIFRVSTPLGAFVEDLINITVYPVNDAPVIFAISNQTGQVGRAWTLDLSPYVQDIDNLLIELEVSTDSPSVTANGLNLTFRFTNEVELDIITVTVSDGKAQAYRQISVTVTAAGFLDGILPWLIPLLALIIGLLAAAMFLRRGRFVVDDALLMYNDGRLLSHVARRVTPDMDSEIFTSMLTAIQDFVTDSFNKDSDWDVNKIEFRNRRIAIEKSESGLVSLALIYQGKGNEEKLNKKAKSILEEVEEKYGDALKDWDGSMGDFKDVKEILTEGLKR